MAFCVAHITPQKTIQRTRSRFFKKPVAGGYPVRRLRVLAMSSMFRDTLKKSYGRITTLPVGWVGLATRIGVTSNRPSTIKAFPTKSTKRAWTRFTAFLQKMQPIIEEQTLCYWSVANVRPRVAVPGGTDGMHSWHKDGTPHPLLKILCYLLPQNAEDGTTEIETLDGNRVLLTADRPGWLMFNPAVLLHRGVPGREKLRPIVEIMLLPALKPDMRARYNGLGANYPWFPPLPKTLPGAMDLSLELPSLQFQQIENQFAALVDKYLVAARKLQDLESLFPSFATRSDKRRYDALPTCPGI